MSKNDNMIEKIDSIQDGSTDDVPLQSIISPAGKVVVISKDLDEAMEFAKNHEHIEVAPREDRRVKRKLDMIVMPLFSFLYMIQFMDKTCIS